MVKLLNFTPHPVVICGEGVKPILTIPPAGTPARCREKRAVIGHIVVDGIEIPLAVKSFEEIEGLPDPEEETMYVVSLPVAQVAKALGREDVVTADELVRDDSGRIVGCRALARL